MTPGPSIHFEGKGPSVLLTFFEVFVTEKLERLRHAHKMYECMTTTIYYMRVQPPTHTITDVYAAVSMLVGPNTHAPRTCTRTYAWVRKGAHAHGTHIYTLSHMQL